MPFLGCVCLFILGEAIKLRETLLVIVLPSLDGKDEMRQFKNYILKYRATL